MTRSAKRDESRDEWTCVRSVVVLVRSVVVLVRRFEDRLPAMIGEHRDARALNRRSHTHRSRFHRSRSSWLEVAGCLALVATAWVQLASSSPAVALAPRDSAPTQSCPPDCGKVAAGDPLLVPYIAVNPGLGWLALPSSDVSPYVTDLDHNLARGRTKVGFNVAAAKWTWSNGKFGLLIVLVSSPRLRAIGLSDPAENAQDLCGASRGEPASQLVALKGIPGSVSGLCAFKQKSAFRGATVVSFVRGNVAALLEVDSASDTPMSPTTTKIAAEQQYLSIPSRGVYVSSDGIDWWLLLLWLVLLAIIGTGLTIHIRRHGWRSVLSDTAGALRRRGPALAVSILAIGGAMAFSMLDFSVLHGVGEWYEAGFNDFWRAWATSADMTYSGGFGHIYLLNDALETAPTWLVLIAPVSRTAFGLSFPYPSAVPYPSAFWVAGPMFLAAMALPIYAGDRWLEAMGVTDLRRRITVLCTMGITLPPIALFGHSEDLLALGAVLYGLIAALEGRHRAVGWWLGVALAFQFLAFLAVPIALVLLKRRQWLAAILPMILLPALVLAIPVAFEPTATLRQLLHQQVFYDLGYISPTWSLAPGVGAFVRLFVALVAIPAALVLRRLLPEDHRNATNAVLWTVAVLFALRVLEPELLPYFLAPTLALLPLSASRGAWWRLIGACVVAVWLNWWLHVAVQGRWSLWLLLIAQLGALALLGWPGASRVPRAAPALRKGAIPAKARGSASSRRKRAPARLS